MAVFAIVFAVLAAYIGINWHRARMRAEALQAEVTAYQLWVQVTENTTLSDDDKLLAIGEIVRIYNVLLTRGHPTTFDVTFMDAVTRVYEQLSAGSG
jgi:hypothetical protein